MDDVRSTPAGAASSSSDRLRACLGPHSLTCTQAAWEERDEIVMRPVGVGDEPLSELTKERFVVRRRDSFPVPSSELTIVACSLDYGRNRSVVPSLSVDYVCRGRRRLSQPA